MFCPQDGALAGKSARIGDRYELTELLGKGGMGMVFAGRHTLLGKGVAIKVLRPDLCGNADQVARFLREEAPEVRLISVEPDSPFHGLEGMKHMATAIVPPIYDPAMAHEARSCTTEAAHAMVRRLAREHGLMVGISSGCNVSSALRLASEVPDGSTIVTILCDGADKYLSDRLWDEG